jgi:hypothetical protein
MGSGGGRMHDSSTDLGDHVRDFLSASVNSIQDWRVCNGFVIPACSCLFDRLHTAAGLSSFMNHLRLCALKPRKNFSSEVESLAAVLILRRSWFVAPIINRGWGWCGNGGGGAFGAVVGTVVDCAPFRLSQPCLSLVAGGDETRDRRRQGTRPLIKPGQT